MIFTWIKWWGIFETWKFWFYHAHSSSPRVCQKINLRTNQFPGKLMQTTNLCPWSLVWNHTKPKVTLQFLIKRVSEINFLNWRYMVLPQSMWQSRKSWSLWTTLMTTTRIFLECRTKIVYYVFWLTGFYGKVSLPDWIWHSFQLIFPYVCFYLEKQLNVPYSLVKHLPGDCLEANCNYLP